MAEENIENIKLNHKNSSEVKNTIVKVVHTIKPIIYFEYTYGIFRFYFVNGELQPSNWRMKAIGVFINVVLLTMFVTFLKFPTVMSGTASFVDIMDEVPSIVVLIQYITSSLTASFLVNSANIGIFSKLAKIDTMLHVESVTNFYKKSLRGTYAFLCALWITHVINSTIDLVTAEEITVRGIVVLPMYFIQKLEIMAFCKYISMVKTRLKIINDYLKAFVQDNEKKCTKLFTIRERKGDKEENLNFIGHASESNTKVRDLAMTYDDIGKVCGMINQVFNFQIFMTLVSTFTYVVITIWTSLYYYRTPGNKSGQLVNIAVWCFSTIYTVAVMSVACERLLLVRNETRLLVNKIIMNYDLPKTMRMQAKAFMELVEARPLRIYIYDMFSVDITLMLKFISVSTTYLIVIIQISHFV